MERNLSERLFRFAFTVIKMLGEIKGGKEIDAIKYQLSKSATSVGANYEESQAAISRADFRLKIIIALKEMREKNYWFKILDSLFPDNKEIKRLFKESNELTLILGKIACKIKPI